MLWNSNWSFWKSPESCQNRLISSDLKPNLSPDFTKSPPPWVKRGRSFVFCLFIIGEMGSKREEERKEKIIRGLMKLPPNRRCINCNSLVCTIPFFFIITMSLFFFCLSTEFPNCWSLTWAYGIIILLYFDEYMF